MKISLININYYSFQNLSNLYTCETISSIDVISTINHCSQSSTLLQTQSNLSIDRSKAQISRQLLRSLVISTDLKMPLAQNYKDDVSLLESETVLSKVTEFSIDTKFTAEMNVSHFIE